MGVAMATRRGRLHWSRPIESVLMGHIDDIPVDGNHIVVIY